MNTIIPIDAIDTTLFTLENDRILYNGERATFSSDYMPIYYNSKYKKHSFKVSKDDKLYAVFSAIDTLVKNKMNSDKACQSLTHSRLLKINKKDNDSFFVGPKLSAEMKYYDEHKKELKQIQWETCECRFIFTFSSIKEYQRYIRCNIYLNQIQCRPKQMKHIDFSECIFD